MLEQLKFVMRGVARRDLVPGLSHFRIQNGRCTGFNGVTALSAPVDIAFDCAPCAGDFIRALNACDDVITLKLDTPHRLIVRSGNFTTAVKCVELDTVPTSTPEGMIIAPPQSVLQAFESLQPFIGIDASREWATGVMLHGQSAYATNNIVLTEYWLGCAIPVTINVPATAVEEVVRVHDELTHLQVSDSSITFHYADGRWVKSQLLSLQWPNIQAAFERSWQGSNLAPVPVGLLAACEKLVRFGDKKDLRVYLRGNDIATTLEGTLDGGALVEIPGLPDRGCFHTQYLLSALSIATSIDFSRYPELVPFVGERLRGAIIGIRY